MTEQLDIPLIAIQDALLELLIVINTIKEAKAAYYSAPRGSKAANAALEKWIELAKTLEEVKAAFKATSANSEARGKALRKLARFFVS